MNKKLIALVLILPMVLMMTLFSAVKTVSLNVTIHVSKIEIFGDEFVSLDLDKEERYFVDYAVYPTTATNKKVIFSLEQVGTQPKAEIEYIDGYIYPKSAGSAYVCLSTADGGHRAKFHVVVKATELKDISCSVEKTVLTIGETTKISTIFNPSAATDKALEYFSSNNTVVTVDDDGIITAKGKGVATVTISSIANESIFDTIDITVNASEILSLGQTEVSTKNQTGELGLTVETAEEYSLTFTAYGETGVKLDDVIEPIDKENPFTDLGDGNLSFNYKFVDEDYYGIIVLKFTISTPTQTVDKVCTINRIETFTASFKNNGDLSLPIGTINYNWKNAVEISPKDMPVTYSIDYSNDNLSAGSLNYLSTANKMGKTTVSITIQSTEYLDQTVVLEKDVYIYPEDLHIDQSTKAFKGIEEVWTIGKTDVRGNMINHDLTVSYGGKAKGEGFSEIEKMILFNSSEPNKVKVENGKINILDDKFNGIVEIYAQLDTDNEKITSDKFNVRCVGEGVEVDSFLDLHTATKQNKIIVLQGDIIDDFGKDASGNNFYQGDKIDKIDSTYDTRFYDEKPQVITLLQFKNDLYGNGFVINADNVTNVPDSDRFTNKSLFNGPLDFVAMGKMASVKAQDNICFAVYENVTINNVELKGCSLEGKDGEQDLTDLDYMGTVVEVLGDNVNIEYSRINNGRTVIRVFGDALDSAKVINLNIKNSVLSCAREFIIRMGSNLLVDDTRDISQLDASKYMSLAIDPTDVLQFPVQQFHPELITKEYEQKYIKTFVSVENSVLKDSGIFCIGMDSHFAGPMLHDALWALPNLKDSKLGEGLVKWKGLSSTSYGAKLIFNGDVRMYDWKNLNNVDSSTLIEMGVEASESIIETLKFDIKEMINHLRDTSMVCHVNNAKYVHGGIAFFGGGKNYSVFEDNSQSFKGIIDGERVKLSGYSISLSDVGQGLLEGAAGKNPFYFMIYSGSSRFTPIVQESILNGDSAYNCIYFK